MATTITRERGLRLLRTDGTEGPRRDLPSTEDNPGSGARMLADWEAEEEVIKAMRGAIKRLPRSSHARLRLSYLLADLEYDPEAHESGGDA